MFDFLVVASGIEWDSVSFKANSFVQIAGLVIFVLAILHTFLVKHFNHFAHKYENNKFKHTIFHFLGEVEAVFGIWAFILFIVLTLKLGEETARNFLTEEVFFTEALFVFVIMSISATKPIIHVAKKIITVLANFFIFLPKSQRFLFSSLTVGPLLGSFITEPAAMTLIAFILKDYIFSKDISRVLRYSLIGVLFVNISIGGTLTNFAAPPILVVASKWEWGIIDTFLMFGWKSVIAIVIINLLLMFKFKKELFQIFGGEKLKKENNSTGVPIWVCIIQLIFLLFVVVYSHYPVIFFAIFCFFLAWVEATGDYQTKLRLKESLLVGFFLAGLLTLGSLQGWWLEKVFSFIENPKLIFLGATSLTAITDNAALTFLGSQVENLSEAFKYSLVAGAVAGGGLTVIANAPNPAGFSILKDTFGKEGISPLFLFFGALIPTIIASIIFILL